MRETSLLSGLVFCPAVGTWRMASRSRAARNPAAAPRPGMCRPRLDSCGRREEAPAASGLRQLAHAAFPALAILELLSLVRLPDYSGPLQRPLCS